MIGGKSTRESHLDEFESWNMPTLVDGESLARIVSWQSAAFSFIVRLFFG